MNFISQIGMWWDLELFLPNTAKSIAVGMKNVQVILAALNLLWADKAFCLFSAKCPIPISRFGSNAFCLARSSLTSSRLSSPVAFFTAFITLSTTWCCDYEFKCTLMNKSVEGRNILLIFEPLKTSHSVRHIACS
jgi:predicted transglutaminase-like protease